MKLLPTWMCIFLYLSSLFHNSESHTINGKPLHHLMTKEEIKRYFGAEHLSNVPEYDVTLPYETNEEGNFASYSLNHRLKRSIEDDAATYHYKINALGEQLHLQVKRNTKFMAPGLKLETRDEKGQRVAKTISRNAYLTGRVASDPDSVVALSVREGLTGIVKRSGDTFLIHPLPTRLARHFKGKEGAKPHLIYRRSSQENDECLTKTDKMSHEKRDLISSETTSHVQEDSNNNGETEKYLEVAILADEHVVEIHGPYTEEHLLLLASIVDVGIFQDTTIGDRKINFVATRLILINSDELGVDSYDPTISHWDVIGKVRAWAHSNNKQDESDPLQFDVAVLIRGGGTGGLAAFGGICQRNDVVSVVKENGLQTAYFIAHEVAHNLGVSHDSQGASAACPNLVNIMSTVGEKGPGSWEWSSCSKENIQNFLMSQRSACLDDPPPPTRPKPPASFYTELPGELVDADDQCQLQYGPEYRQCPQRKSNCDSLYCTPNGYTCLSRVLRPVDGTPCGLRHWCIKGYCVDNGSPLINGGWSEWSDYTACTPSCRGGVRYRERTCTNPPPQNGGEDCEGLSRALWETCNNDVPCDTSEPSFRDQQCKQINPNYSAYDATDRNPCSLACQSESSYHFHGDVIDGTRCLSSNLNVYDVCIEGECKVSLSTGISNLQGTNGVAR